METSAGRILFVDRRHSFSKLAERFASRLAPADVKFASAGVEPGEENAAFIAVINEMGLSTAECGTAKIGPSTGCHDMVVTIGDEARLCCPAMPGMPARLHWDFRIAAADTATYRSAVKDLEQAVRDLFARGTFRAISQLRGSFTNILDSLEEGILAHDLDRKIIFFSRGAEKITGVSSESVLGRDCHDLFAPHFCSGNCIFTEPGNFSGICPASYTTVFHTEGSRAELDVKRLALRNAEGEVVGAIAVFNDTTRVHELEHRLGELQSFSGIIGQDHSMLAIFELIKDLAQSDFSVVITGESGTGKELVAAAIHNESNRRDKLFVPINCGALPEGTLESELFGHVKGAFTGAIRDKKGRFELADKGTLFLDEVAELSPQMQVKLLRVLQEGAFEPVGGEATRRVDVRVICATNRNLRDMVAKGTFRDDLYYRLAVVPIEVPPLRDRRTDIPLLAEYFLKKTAEKLQRKDLKFSQDTMALFMGYSWPGNVRQLQNVIQFSLIKCREKRIDPEHLPPEILNSTFVPMSVPRVPGKAGRKPKLTNEVVERALAKAGGNKAKAARLLGVGRATLYNFMNMHKELLTTAEA